jgi:iron complex outermembrane receptor protein
MPNAVQQRSGKTQICTILLARQSVLAKGVMLGVLMSSATSVSAQSDVTEEIIVTGTAANSTSLKDKNTSGSRLGITALEIPATVGAISFEAMEIRGDANMVDAISHAGGIAAQPVAGSGGYGFAVRGFGNSSVTILYDGTKSLVNTGSMTYPYDTWNVDRIEVLNGPASVLYGGGAIGAAINVIPRRPSEAAQHSVRLVTGSFNTKRIGLDTTGPLSERLQYRFDASYNESDGYVDRGDSDGMVLSGALRFEATDTLDFTLSVDYAERNQWAYIGTPLINGVVREELREINYTSDDSRIPFDDRRITLETSWQVTDTIQLKNTSYFLDADRLWRYPAQYIYRPATNDILRRGFGTYLQHQNQAGDHAELVWDHPLFGMEHTLSTGFDIARLRNERLVDNYAGTDIIDLYNTTPGIFPGGAISKNYQQSRAEQRSFFAEDRLVVLPNLSLLTGIRVDHVETDRENLVNFTTASKTDSPVSWRVGAVYEIAPQFNLYGQHSTAVDPVGNLCCISAAQLDFDMSDGKQTEFGMKQVAWDGKLEWTLAAYRIVKNKLLTPDPANIALSIQVGQQSARGVEASVAVMPTPAWRIEVNYTTLNAEYDNFFENVAGTRTSRNGNRPINIPERLANVWATWDFLPQWQAQIGVEYHGDIYANTDNSQRVPSYTVFDAGLRWTPSTSFTVDLRATNLSDRLYAYASSGDGSNRGQWVLGAPRGYELALTTKF